MKLRWDRMVELEIKSETIGYRWPVFSLRDFVLLPARSFHISLIKRKVV